MRPEDRNDGSTSKVFPRLILCVPGSWADRDEAVRRLADAKLALEGTTATSADGGLSLEADFRPSTEPRMVDAFRHSSCRLRPSLREGDLPAIASHRSVLYLLSPAYGRSTALEEATRLLRLVPALLDAGGLGAKCESSAIAHSADRWRELAQRADPDALFDAFVRLPIQTEAGELSSCGMHLLGGPDALISRAHVSGGNDRKAAEILEAFLRGLLRGSRGEDAAAGFRSALEPCREYAEDDFFWNRWGVFRLEPDGPKTLYSV